MCIVDPAVLSGQLHREDNLYVSQRHDASCSQKIARFRGRPARSWRAGRSGRSWLALCGELSFRRSGCLTVLLDGRLWEAVEIAQQVGPFDNQVVAKPSKPFKNPPQNFGAVIQTSPAAR